MLRRKATPFKAGEFGLCFGRAHIGPEYAAGFHQRIGFKFDLFGITRGFCLRRHFHALAGDVEFPAVIGAAQAAFLIAPEPERHAAMGAEFIDQAQPALAVAKRQQALAEQLDAHRRTIILRQFGCQQGGQPIGAKQFAHGRASACAGEEDVVFCAHCIRLVSPAKRSARRDRYMVCEEHCDPGSPSASGMTDCSISNPTSKNPAPCRCRPPSDSRARSRLPSSRCSRSQGSP